ncbi:hypothetical protein UlMin_007120 [Ulmus minor]
MSVNSYLGLDFDDKTNDDNEVDLTKIVVVSKSQGQNLATSWWAVLDISSTSAGFDMGLHIKHSDRLTLSGYSDADWACNSDDKKSTSGYCVYFGDTLVSWSSKKQCVVSRSSTKS